MAVLLKICSIFSEHLFTRTLPGDHYHPMLLLDYYNSYSTPYFQGSKKVKKTHLMLARDASKSKKR